MRRHKKNGNLAEVMDQVKPYAHRAQKKALKAQKKVSPAVESAKDRLGPAVDDAREKAEAALASAMVASEPYRQEAMQRSTAAWLALRGELRAPKPKRHWVRNILLIGGVGGAVYAAYRVLRGGTASEWLPRPARVSPEEDAESESTPEQPTDAKAGDMAGKHKEGETSTAPKEPAATGSRATTNRSGPKPSEPPKN